MHLGWGRPVSDAISLAIVFTESSSRHVLTGSYHNYFRLYPTADVEDDVVLQADKSAFKAKKIGGPMVSRGPNGGRGLKDAMQTETLDFNKKILHASWHPKENTIAVCVPNNSLFHYS